MALSDLETAVRVAEARGITFIRYDGVYTAQLNLYGLKGLAKEPVRIPETNFAMLVTSLGGTTLFCARTSCRWS